MVSKSGIEASWEGGVDGREVLDKAVGDIMVCKHFFVLLSALTLRI